MVADACLSRTELDVELMKKLRDFVGVAEGSTDTSTMAVLCFLYIYLCVFSDSQ